MNRTAAQTREHVLRVAHDLFYWHGIRATGVDRVAAEAGVAPTTLYRLFASKDDLVAAYVAQADEMSRSWISTAIDGAGPDPRQRILAVFDALAKQIEPDLCRGCAFLMTLAEFPDPTLPAHRHAVAAKTWVREQVGELTAQLSDVDDPETLADQLTLVIEGVNASTQSLGADGPATKARLLAETLLADAMGQR